MQNKYGEKWTHADLNNRNSFPKITTKITTSIIKFKDDSNTHEERIEEIDKKNYHVECPPCAKEELWEHVALFDRNKKTREDWLMITKDKFQAIAKKIKAANYESKITE